MKKTYLVLILCLAGAYFASPVISEESLIPFGFFDFTGGLNTKIRPNLVAPNQTVDAQNVLFDEALGIITRKKSSVIASLPVASDVKILGSYVFKKDDGSTSILVQAGDTIYSTTDLNEESIWTTVKSGLSSIYPVQYATHYNKCWMTNGVDPVFNYDGVTATDYSFIQKGQYILSAKNRLWIASSFNAPSTVWFSKININPATASDWPSTYFFNIGMGDGQIIKSIREVGNNIMVWKEGSLWGILGNAETSSDGFAVRQYLNNYGSVTNASISDYSDGKIFLDRKNLYLWNNTGLQEISEIIKPDIEKIGVISANYGRWNITTPAEFNEGSFADCLAFSEGYVASSTTTKKWATTADFNASGYEQTQSTSMANEIKIANTSGTGYQKILLVRNGDGNVGYPPYGSGLYSYTGTSDGGTLLGTFYPYSYMSDDDDNTFSAIVNGGPVGGAGWIFFSQSGATTVPFRPKRIRVRMRNAIWTSQWQRTISAPFYWTSANISQFKIETGNSVWDEESKITYAPPVGYSNATTGIQDIVIDVDDSAYNDVARGYPTKIAIVNVTNIYNQTTSDGRFANCLLATVIYDVSAWTYTNVTNYTSGNFISPIHNTGNVSPGLQYLRRSDYSGIGASTGAITYYTRTSANSDMSGASSWAETVGTSSGVIQSPSARYFQWKAEMITSSNTFTPIIYDVTFQYAPIAVSTYTSKVFYSGRKLTQWGSFVAADEGTVTYQVRSATWAFTAGNTGISWSTISNNSDLSVPSTHYYIQWRGILNGAAAKIKGATVNWFEGGATGGGTQDVASINFDNRYYLATSTWTTHNDVIYIHDKNKAWTKFTGIPVSSFFTTDNKLYATSSTAPVVIQLYVADGNEPPFTSYWKSAFTPLGGQDIDKQIRYVYTTGSVANNSDFNFEYQVGSSTNVTSIPQDLRTTSNNRQAFSDTSTGRNFYFTVRSTNSFELQGFNIYYRAFPLR